MQARRVRKLPDGRGWQAHMGASVTSSRCPHRLAHASSPGLTLIFISGIGGVELLARWQCYFRARFDEGNVLAGRIEQI
jgi:hypothetical protein